MYKFFLAGFFFMYCLIFRAQAQIDEEVYSLIKTLPSLDSLLYLAVKNAPNIKAQSERIDQERVNLKIAKKMWLDNLFTNAGYTYTNGFNSLSQSSSGNGVESTALQVGDIYQVGVYLRFSAFDIIGTRLNKQKVKHEIKIAQYDKATLISELEEAVKSIYAELIFMESRMQILDAKKQTLFLNYEMAEKKFLEGQVSINELSRMLEFLTKSEEEYEKAKLEFRVKLIELETLAGTPLR